MTFLRQDPSKPQGGRTVRRVGSGEIPNCHPANTVTVEKLLDEFYYLKIIELWNRPD